MIYSGQDSATLEPLDLSRMVEDMLELLKVSISKHAQLRTELAKRLPAVLGNATQIRQILMNLIINASEAIGDRTGEIYIATNKLTRHDDADRGAAFDMPEGEYVRLTVADTGCGMSDAAKARIFEPFFTTKVNGHGLGLALVQGIVRSHGGSIKVESNRESGTTFEVLLPSASELIARPAPGAAKGLVSEGAQVCATVLLVEDEDMLRMAVTKALTRRGYCVFPASNGDSAIETFESKADTISVVVLDLTLPGMSGSDVFRRVRRIRPRVPVILTSAYERWGDGRNVTQEERVAFLKKPYRIGALVRTLNSAAAGLSGESAYAAGQGEFWLRDASELASD
jgi:CheY-like chemotaxis protein/two-component sensor histidine kinase